MDKTEERYAKVMKLVDKFSEPRKSQVVAMLESEIGVSYFTAPGSSREAYHDCYPGGLVDHSLRVATNLYNLCKTLCPDKYSKEQIAFVGLFHDFGKAGDGIVDRYIPVKEDYLKRKGIMYDTNPELKWMTTADAGLYLLQLHGISVSSEEWLAIKLNDGQYARENDPYKMREPRLALLLHFADLWDAQRGKNNL